MGPKKPVERSPQETGDIEFALAGNGAVVKTVIDDVAVDSMGTPARTVCQ